MEPGDGMPSPCSVHDLIVIEVGHCRAGPMVVLGCDRRTEPVAGDAVQLALEVGVPGEAEALGFPSIAERSSSDTPRMSTSPRGHLQGSGR